MKIQNKVLSDEEQSKQDWYIDSQFKLDDDLPINDKFYIDKSKIMRVPIEIYSLALADTHLVRIIDNKDSIINISSFLESPEAQEDESKDSLKIIVKHRTIFELPIQFQDLYSSIEKSKYIIELQENWDDEGSPAYKESTWVRAIEFIYNYTNSIYSKTTKSIDAPLIYHGPNGSIDILWKKENYKLLINIPENLKEPASFYGDDYKTQTIKGTFNPSRYDNGLLLVFLSLL